MMNRSKVTTLQRKGDRPSPSLPASDTFDPEQTTRTSTTFDPVVFPDASAIWVSAEEEKLEESGADVPTEPTVPVYYVYHYHYHPDHLTGWQFWLMGGSIALLLSLTYVLTQNPANQTIHPTQSKMNWLQLPPHQS